MKTSVSSKRLLLLSSLLIVAPLTRADGEQGVGDHQWYVEGGAAPAQNDALADQLIRSIPPGDGPVLSSPGATRDVPSKPMGAMVAAPVSGPSVSADLAQYFENAQRARPTATSRSPSMPSDVFVLPETLATVAVSNQFVNRVTCPGVVGDVLNSTEKPMEVSTTDGGHIFVKFLVMKDHTGEHLQTAPADLHVVCDGKVYTLILKPQAMDSQTIRLGNPAAEQFASNAKEFGALPLEEKIKKITLAVYHETTPPGFQRRRLSDDRRYAKLFRDVIVQGLWEVTAPGLGLKATEYKLIVNKPMTVDARLFLRPEFGAVVGVTVDPPVVTQDQRGARLIVVERSVGK